MRMLTLCLIALLFDAPPARAVNACDMAHYPPVEQRYQRGLLFRIEQCNGPPSYLFGTVHLARPEIIRAAGPAFEEIREVHAAGFEIGEPEQAIEAIARGYMLFPRNGADRLSALMGEKDFKRMLALFKNTPMQNLPFDMIRPWAVAAMIQEIGEPEGSVLDEQLKQTATALGKPVFGLETTEEQMQVLGGLPQDVQLRILKDAIDEYDNIAREKKRLLAAYIAGDARAIMASEEEMATDSKDRELDEMLRRRLLTDRNHRMEKRLLPHLQGQSVLLSVGALHLMGQEGLLHLLELDGYAVTPMP